MNRPARTLAALIFTASIGLTAFGATAASAADIPPVETPPAGGTCTAPTDNFNSFLPPASPGRIVGTSEGHVFITNPNDGRTDTWDRLFGYVGVDAPEIAEDLNSAQDKAEEQFDRKGNGDTSDTSDNEYFKTAKFRDGYGVVSTSGGTVAVYDSEEKANAVANALEAEMKAQVEEHGKKAEPCVDNTPFDPRDEGRY